MCAKLGVPMHLIEYTDMPEEFDTSLNYYLCNLAGIRKTRCKKTDVPSTIKQVVDSYQGKKVKLVYGGGKSLEGIYAYYDAVSELSKQIDSIDHLFITCGTGTTLTGVCAGMKKYYPNAHIHAISVARTYDVEKTTLDEDMNILNAYLNTSFDFSNMSFYEDFLCGGYDLTSPELLQSIKECISNEGMLIDPIYTGKTFWGMTEIIDRNKDLYRGKNIVFWNIGGVFNLLSSN
jgi:D-cysteine desulfhydrase